MVNNTCHSSYFTVMVLFLQVVWKCLFDKSSRDHGTLGHLCSLLGRLPHANIPKKDLYACLDALLTAFKGHVVAATCDFLGLNIHVQTYQIVQA